MSLGLALSGGGVKGAAHIGVLQALNEENINIDYISGASSGSIVAALFAAGYSPCSILKLFNFYSRKIIEFDKKAMFKSIINANKGVKCINKYDNLEQILYFVFKTRNIVNIEDIKMGIAISTVDINNDEIVYFLNRKVKDEVYGEIYEDCGKLHNIVKASCSYPVLFEPKIYNNRLLVDGGLRKNVPVSILKNIGVDKVIAINLESKILPLKEENILNIGFRCVNILGKHVNEDELKKADFIITPKNISKIGMLDFNCINIAANEGYYETKKKISKIKQFL